MENRFFSRFDVYDQFGYLFVGGIALLVMGIDLFFLEKLRYVEAVSAQSFLVWLVAAYFLGHVVQAIANVFIRENKTDFSDSERETLEEAGKYFGEEQKSLEDIYLLCYMVSLAKDATGHVKAFNAYYGLYRGWTMVFALNSFFMLCAVFLVRPSLPHILILAISVAITVLFRKRSRRFYAYSRQKTLQIFIIASKDKL